MASNGRRLRLLRDSRSLARHAYVEVDLETIFEAGAYSDFFVLFRLLHQSRLEGPPAECWLEKWAAEARQASTRALDGLRQGVEEAIQAVGEGVVSHPRNLRLLRRLASGELPKQELYRQLLRTAYRLIFLLVAEERDLLAPETADPKAKQRYQDHYSARRLRNLAGRLRGTAHGDLWQGLKLVFRLLDGGCPELGLPALGSFLWSPRATPDLDEAELSNGALLEAFRALAWAQEESRRRPVDWRNLGPEELGSVYESLLELHPEVDASAGHFRLATAAGHERKTTGSYYTPTSLIECLLDTALDPVIETAVAGKSKEEKETSLLALKVCDPACGSGHFLLAAAHRIARRLASVRSEEEEPPPPELRHALRDVIGRCLYGVDLNPMALELCKVSLWLEALDPGRPLSFLDHHLRCGHSLLGATPALISRGIPDAALEPITGDDNAYCRDLKKLNKKQRTKPQFELFTLGQAPWMPLGDLGSELLHVEEIVGTTLADEQKKEERFRAILASTEYEHSQLLADAWCAAFVWRKKEEPGHPPPITEETFRRLERNPHTVPAVVKAEVRRLAEEYRFFHWHLAFPHVFRAKAEVEDGDPCGWEGGFDCVLGNPPWDTLSPDSKEFFSQYDPNIRFQDPDGQEATIDHLIADVSIARKWASYQRDLYALVHFLKASGRFTLFAPGDLGKGDFNTYRMFVETALRTVRSGGRASQIVPEGLYNGANSMAIRKELFEGCELYGFLGFENKRKVWFDGIDGRSKFTIYSATRPGKTEQFRIAFNIRSQAELASAVTGNALYMPVRIVEAFSPDALAVMEFASQRDIDIAAKMYERYPKFGDQSTNPPHRHYMREIDMGNDRELFTEDATGVPVYEGRMVGQYDHRAKGYRSGRGRKAEWEELPFSETTKSIQPQWYIPVDQVPDKARERYVRYRIGFCDVTSPTNERSLVATLIPPGAICGHKVPTIVFLPDCLWAYPFWLSIANSFAMDFLARLKVSLSMTYTILDSMPFPRGARDSIDVGYLVPRVLQLLCTSDEMVPFWQASTEEGLVSPRVNESAVPGELSEEKRLRLLAEIDAYVAREVYGLTKDELQHILAAFPGVRKKDEKRWGTYRTKDTILEIYDAMAVAMETGVPYQTVLDPPPASALVAHPARVQEAQAKPPEPLRVAPDLLERLGAVPAGELARPPALSEDDFTLLTLAETLRALSGPVEPNRVTLISQLVLAPALALPFMDGRAATAWRQAIGTEARPLPVNVLRFSVGRQGHGDLAWGRAVQRLTAGGGLQVETGTGFWSAGERLPAGNQPWLSTRVQVAVHLLEAIDTVQAEQNLASFLERLEHGEAERAVS
ncbi:MAG TPA: N-6 DNA methylase [Thermoanaerobaculia bacterium]|nr:N-6 DNA methylase [Thermoanaerobaculia bacterium]